MLHIHTIPAFEDNYFWLIQPDIQAPDAYILDPGSATVVEAYLQQHRLQLQGIVLTHHHHDHIDGAAELSRQHQCPIYGPRSARIPHVTHHLGEGDVLLLGAQRAKVLAIPGHTLDHIAYLIETPDQVPLLFSGDTLFGAGCGRIFDGNATLLYRALQRIAALPDDTLIYAGHEYTLANITFALTIEPKNAALQQRQRDETEKRQQGIASLPTVLAVEKRTNPFLRCHLNAVKQSVERLAGEHLISEADIFAALRLSKDRF